VLLRYAVSFACLFLCFFPLVPFFREPQYILECRDFSAKEIQFRVGFRGGGNAVHDVVREFKHLDFQVRLDRRPCPLGEERFRLPLSE